MEKAMNGIYKINNGITNKYLKKELLKEHFYSFKFEISKKLRMNE